MLVKLGKRVGSEDVVDLLLECHERIRRFLVMARALALATAPPAHEVAATAAQVRRYFAESFPLHVADEEIDISPRVGPNAGMDRIAADHRAHEPEIAELVRICGQLEHRPEQHAALAPRLRDLARDLAADLEAHLELEERTMFPAVRELPGADRDAIRTAMRQRRARALGVAT